MFRRILVAMDGSESARSAFVFVSDWARQFDAEVWFIQLTEESTTRQSQTVTDFGLRGRRLANTFSVSGATRAVRDWQLVSGIAEAAESYKADLIVLGFERARLRRTRSCAHVREQLSVLTDVPVMVAPKQRARRAASVPRPATPRQPAVPSTPVWEPIALGPAPVDQRLVHV